MSTVLRVITVEKPTAIDNTRLLFRIIRKTSIKNSVVAETFRVKWKADLVSIHEIESTD